MFSAGVKFDEFLKFFFICKFAEVFICEKLENVTAIYEAENGAANYAVYYLQLSEGIFEVIQGVLFDAIANENAPWFMAYDLDWDISNDTPVDEETAMGVIEAWRNLYTAADYIPYSQYK